MCVRCELPEGALGEYDGDTTITVNTTATESLLRVGPREHPRPLKACQCVLFDFLFSVVQSDLNLGACSR